MDIRPDWFQFSADTRQIRFDRAGFDLVRHVYNEEAECVQHWMEGKLEYALRAEAYVCLVECSSVALTASVHTSLSHSNGHHSQLGCWAKEHEVWFILTPPLSS